MMKNSIAESELILTTNGEIYHLGITPEQISRKIIIVGDQNRVETVSSFFDTVYHKQENREFVCHTGTYQGKDISVISSGIGTDNIDIILNEIDALFNIDFTTKQIKDELTTLEIVRIGTCGILQDEIPVDSFILSNYALGIDNVGHFYKRNNSEIETELENEILSFVNLPNNVKPYLTEASSSLNAKLDDSHVFRGITVTSSGFYGPQGRKLRLELNTENFIDQFSLFKSSKGERFSNLEMECSALFSLSKALGHQATAICLGLANRKKKTFSTHYQEKIFSLIKFFLDRI